MIALANDTNINETVLFERVKIELPFTFRYAPGVGVFAVLELDEKILAEAASEGGADCVLLAGLSRASL